VNGHQFSSRRNRVWREGFYVRKQILPGHDRPNPACAAKAEFDTLRRLSESGVLVPRPVSLEGDVFIIEYLEGVTLTQAIERAEDGDAPLPAETLAERMAEWFASFYAAVPEGVRRGDVNGRNFILTPDGRLYGVDFEELPPGAKETDLGQLTAFILTYDPPYTAYKKRLSQALTRRFAAGFGINAAFALREREREFQNMLLRRQGMATFSDVWYTESTKEGWQ